MTRHARQSGFTLVEVLLAMAIAGILFTILFSALDGVVKARETVADYSTPYAVGPAILDTIAADLGNVYFYDLKDHDGLWGADAEVGGREADGLSFVAAELSRDGEPTLMSNIVVGRSQAHERRSVTTEVQFVCRESRTHPGDLELWRREDFYVDDLPHEGGIYRLVYDRVFSLKFEYIRRDQPPNQAVGGAANAKASAESMRQDGWNSLEEKGLPRAVIVTLSIHAREPGDETRHSAEPEVFVFRRWITLPQVHVSVASEQDAAWDGVFRDRGAGGLGRGAAGKKPGEAGTTGNKPARGATGLSRLQAAGAGHPVAGGANNPFLQAMQNRAPHSAGGTGAFGNLFQPH